MCPEVNFPGIAVKYAVHDGGLSGLLLQFLGGLAVVSQTVQITKQAETIFKKKKNFFCMLKGFHLVLFCI